MTWNSISLISRPHKFSFLTTLGCPCHCSARGRPWSHPSSLATVQAFQFHSHLSMHLSFVVPTAASGFHLVRSCHTNRIQSNSRKLHASTRIYVRVNRPFRRRISSRFGCVWRVFGGDGDAHVARDGSEARPGREKRCVMRPGAVETARCDPR